MSFTAPKTRSTVVPLLLSGLISIATFTGTSDVATAQTVGLARVGPSDPVHGYPLFYEDTQGLRLGLCLNPANCLLELPDPTQPVHFPDNFSVESFYWSGETSMDGPNASALLVLALEAAFANEQVVLGDNVVFARVRIRITGLVDGATYIVTHPYGVDTFVAGVDGPNPGTINVTRDVGIGAPMQFGLALGGEIGPFLTPVGFIHPGIPGQSIDNGGAETLVQGSPFGTNFFRIQGPQAGSLFPANTVTGTRAQVNSFALTGTVASQLGARVDKVTVNKTSTETAVNVWASTAPGQSLVVNIAGSPSLPMQGGGAAGHYFARAVFPGGGGGTPNSVSVTNLTDFPNTTFPGPSLTDTVEITSAVFTIGGDLLVSARSTDRVGNPTLTASGDGVPPTALNNLGNGEASGSITLLPGTVPPKVITVESSTGGTAESHVVVEGNGAVGGGVPLVANAGPDQTVASGALVHLSGLNSTGNITTFAWTDNSPLVNLVGANTATPSFTAPIVGTNLHLDVTLTLLIRDGIGNASVDTIIVHVNGPSGPLDIVTITEARYVASKNQWRVGGSNTLHQGQSVRIFIGAIGDRSRQLATVPVANNGSWLFQSPNSNGLAPLGSDNTVWAESTLPGTAGQLPFRRL